MKIIMMSNEEWSGQYGINRGGTHWFVLMLEIDEDTNMDNIFDIQDQ